MKNNLRLIITIAAFGLISICAAAGFAQKPVGDDTAIYNETVAKISKTAALFAVKKTNFEKVVKTAKPNDKSICQSLSEWNMVFHDRVANFNALVEMQKTGKFEIHSSKTGDLIGTTDQDLKENEANFTRLAAAHQCRLSNKTSSGAENTFVSLMDGIVADIDTTVKSFEDSTKAEANFKKVTDDFGSYLDVKAAEDLFVQGYFDQAAKKLDATIKANPNYAPAYAARAMLVYEKDSQRFLATEKSMLESAQPDAEKAIKLDPHNALAQWIISAIDDEDPYNGRLAPAEEKNALLYVNQDIAKNPTDPENYYIRGRMQFAEKDAADFTKAISFNSEFGRAYQKRGEIYSLDHDYYNALDDFNRTMAIFPKSVSAYRERAKVYYKLGEIGKATADLRRALEFDPKNEHLAILLKSYNEPVSDQEIILRYKFFKGEFNRANGIFELQMKKYNETVAARPQNPVVCAALTELKTTFQNQQSAADKLLFVNDYSQIAQLKQVIADNKTIADYMRETAALFAPEAANRGCK